MQNKKTRSKPGIKTLAVCIVLSHSFVIAAPRNQTANTAVQQAQNESNSTYQQLLELIKQNKLNVARDYAKKLIAADDKAIRAYLVLAEIANLEKNTAEMESVLLMALQKAKGLGQAEIEVFKVLAKVYIATKQPAKILPIAETIARSYPNDSTAIGLLAQTYILNRNKAAAEKLLSHFIIQNKQDTDNRLFLAKLLMEQANRKADVMLLLDQAITLAPNKPDALAIKAAYLIQLKNIAEALDLVEKLDKQFPQLLIGKQLKAELYLAEQKTAAAVDMYQQIYKQQPNETNLFNLVDLMIAQNQATEAIDFLEKESTKNPKNASLHFKLANIYTQNNDLPHTEEHYKAILAANPDNIIALNNLAFLYAKNNDSQAIIYANKAYAKYPNEPAIADTYGYIQVMQGNPKQGLIVLEKAAVAAPKVYDIQFHLAIAYAKTDNKKKAIETLETLLKTGQNFSEKESAVKLLNELKS